MTRYLFDTNIISELAEQPLGNVAKRVADCPRESASNCPRESASTSTSIIVVAELRFGLAKRPSPRRGEAYKIILAQLDILAFDESADAAYGAVRAVLEQAGTPIGANDLLIASQALALCLTILTENESEFRRVPGLAVEYWLRD